MMEECTICRERQNESGTSIISDTTIMKFEAILKESDINISVFRNSLICKVCNKATDSFYNFMSDFVEKEGELLTEVDTKEEVDLYEVLVDAGKLDKCEIDRDLKICRICFKVANPYCCLEIRDSNGLLAKIVSTCLPQFDLSLTPKTFICKECHSNLLKCYQYFLLCTEAVETMKKAVPGRKKIIASKLIETPVKNFSYECQMCPGIFHSLEEIMVHVNYHENQNCVYCWKCNMGFAKVSNLRHHFLSRHYTDIYKVVEEESEEDIDDGGDTGSKTRKEDSPLHFNAESEIEQSSTERVPCSLCLQNFQSTEDYVIHLCRKAPDYCCGHCSLAFYSLDELDDHICTSLDVKVEPTDGCFDNLCIKMEPLHDGGFASPLVNKDDSLVKAEPMDDEKINGLPYQFDTKIAAKVNKSEQPVIRKFHCYACGFRPVDSMELLEHLNGCEKLKTCPYCPFKTDMNRKLEMHCYTAHNTTAVFVCDHCRFVSTEEDLIKTHNILVHEVDLSVKDDILRDAGRVKGISERDPVTLLSSTSKLDRAKSILRATITSRKRTEELDVMKIDSNSDDEFVDIDNVKTINSVVQAEARDLIAQEVPAVWKSDWTIVGVRSLNEDHEDGNGSATSSLSIDTFSDNSVKDPWHISASDIEQLVARQSGNDSPKEFAECSNDSVCSLEIKEEKISTNLELKDSNMQPKIIKIANLRQLNSMELSAQNDDSFKCVEGMSVSAPSRSRKLTNSEKCKRYRERKRLRKVQATQAQNEGQDCEPSTSQKLTNSEMYLDDKRLEEAQAAQAQNEGQHSEPSMPRKLTNSEMCKRYRERKRLREAQSAQVQNEGQHGEPSTLGKLTNSEKCKRYRKRKCLREAQAAQAQNQGQHCEQSMKQKLTNSEMCKQYRERKRLREEQAAQTQNEGEVCKLSMSRKIQSERCKRYRELKRLRKAQAVQGILDQTRNNEIVTTNDRILPTAPPPNSGTTSIFYADRYKRKKTICKFCSIAVTNFERHLSKHHTDTKEVQEMFNYPKRHPERKKIISLIRNAGKFEEFLKGRVCPKYGPRRTDTEYYPCYKCKALLLKKYLSRHSKQCILKDVANKQTRINHAAISQTLIAASLDETNTMHKLRVKEEVFSRMKADEISMAAKTDLLIRTFGENYLKKHKTVKMSTICSNKMRELGRFLLEFRKITNNPNCSIQHMLVPNLFSSALECARKVARYDKDTKSYEVPTLAASIGTSLKQVCNIFINLTSKEDQSLNVVNKEATIEETEQFKSLIESQWSSGIGSPTSILHEKEWEAPRMLPLTCEILKLKNYVIQVGDQAMTTLQFDRHNKKEFNNLVQASLILTILFNRRKIGDIQYTKIKTYTDQKNLLSQEECEKALSASEKILTQHCKRKVIRYEGRKTTFAIIFPARLQDYIDFLLTIRSEGNFIGNGNPHLFLCTGNTISIRGDIVMGKFAEKVGLKFSHQILSNKLRKQIAIIMHVFDLTKEGCEQLAQFMGHTEQTPVDYYKLPQNVYQTAKVSKLLLLMEKGVDKYKGKSLNDIDINPEQEIAEVESDYDDRLFTPTVKQSIEEDEPERKKCKITGRTPWTPEQMKIVKSYFKRNLKLKIPPKKKECVKLINQHPVIFHNKDWVRIKTFVYNTYRSSS